MAEDYWTMVRFYRNFDVPFKEYPQFKKEIRILWNKLKLLSLQGKILDTAPFPDTETIKDQVLDARVLKEENVGLVLDSLRGTKYLARSIERKKYEA